MQTQAMLASFALPPVLDFAAAEGFQASLIEKLQAHHSLQLDASAVETLTTPCVQLILAAAKSHQIQIHNASAAFDGAFSDLGLNWEDYAERTGGQAMPDMPEIAALEKALQDAATDPVAGLTADAAPGETAEPAAGETPDIADSEQPNGSAMAKRILTIDDSKTMRDMLMLTLSDAGYDVIQAVDGEDGVNVLKGGERVDVVITDINMPKMDGYEVIRQLRKDPANKTLPILVLTTESDTDKRSIAREAGATGWMVKPFDPERLVQTIRKVSP
jgi:two-component system, chemotaxis family, chemotaxis protein CheY